MAIADRSTQVSEDSDPVGRKDTPSPTSSHSTQDTRNTSSFTTANEYQNPDSPSLSEERSQYESAPESPTPTKAIGQSSQQESAPTPTKAQQGRAKGHKKTHTRLIQPAIPLNFSPVKNLQTATPSSPATPTKAPLGSKSQAPEEEVKALATTPDAESRENKSDLPDTKDTKSGATPPSLDSIASNQSTPETPVLPTQELRVLSPIMEIPAPKLQPVNEIFGLTGKDFEHYYVCHEGLTPSKNVLGIPEKYAQFAVEGRAVEIRGVPSIVDSTLMRPLFRKFSNNHFLYDICVTDTKSEATFRWVILDTFKDATELVHYLLGSTIDWAQWNKGGTQLIFGFPAWLAGYTFVANERLSVASLLNQRIEDRGISFERKFGAQQVPKARPEPEKRSNLVPIPKIVLPDSAHKQKIPPTQAGQQAEEHEHAVAETEMQAEHKAQERIEAELSSSTAIQEPGFTTQATSWAKMAGTLTSTNRTIDLKTENKPSGAAPRLKPVGRIPHVEKRGEPVAKQLRLVFLMNLPPNITLSDISDGIQEGPIVSITFNNDADTGSRFAGVIFQNAEDAEAFHIVLRNEKIAKTPGRFKFVVDSAISEDPIATEEIIKKMGAPIYATRRLTIVKKAFFFKMKLIQLKNLCERYVASEDIQKVWLYNGGNATVIFAKVDDAIKVKEALDKERDNAEPGGHYHDLQITFSKDPCVQKISFTTDLA